MEPMRRVICRTRSIPGCLCLPFYSPTAAPTPPLTGSWNALVCSALRGGSFKQVNQSIVDWHDDHVALPTHTPFSFVNQNSDHEVPENQKRAHSAGRIASVLGKACALRCLLQLLVTASHVVCSGKRVRHQLLNVRRLRRKIAHEERLQLRDFQQRLLSGSAGPSISSPEQTPAHFPVDEVGRCYQMDPGAYTEHSVAQAQNRAAPAIGLHCGKDTWHGTYLTLSKLLS